ncbi:hypothetical protein RJT34_32781 [Clitoria ternatea]|uniref:Transmembrane protein n=1 Tax=Clitoria ternatea TaxID=43366 RepID=A0AAN9I688_CLITE
MYLSLPQDVTNGIDRLQTKILTAADNLSNKTKYNSKLIRQCIYGVSVGLIIVASVMLVVAFLGFLFSVFGLYYVVYFLVIVTWILIVGTFILSGSFLVLHNAIGDTCVAMEEWTLNPTAKTVMDDIIPCVEKATMEETFTRAKTTAYTIVQLFDTVISTVISSNFISYNKSGPTLPLLCNPFNADYTVRSCATDEVTIESAAQAWKSGGRLTPYIYRELEGAVNVTYGLYRYGPTLADLADCTTVRKAFADIRRIYCPGSFRCSKHKKPPRAVAQSPSSMAFKAMSLKAILLQIVKPSSQDLQRRKTFRPKPTRFSLMNRNTDAVAVS